MVVIGTADCGQNMAAMIPAATMIETAALRSRSWRSAARAASSALISRERGSSAAPGSSARTA